MTLPSASIFSTLALLGMTTGAIALSQIVDDQGQATGDLREGIVAVPLPPLPGDEAGGEGIAPENEGETLTPDAGEIGEPSPSSSRGLDEAPQSGRPVRVSDVSYDAGALPKPVRDLRARLIEIAKSGEIEDLRPYIGSDGSETVLSFGGEVDDPIAHLKRQSGDEEGLEILAILLEILQAGHVAIEPNSADAIYVWPYFAQTRLDTLTPPQKVELFELATFGDYQAMLEFGAYNFYRLGITPEGELAYFVAGD